MKLVESLPARAMGVERAGNLWVWNDRSKTMELISPAGARLERLSLPDLWLVDTDAEWGVAGLFQSGHEIRWIRWDGITGGQIRELQVFAKDHTLAWKQEVENPRRAEDRGLAPEGRSGGEGSRRHPAADRVSLWLSLHAGEPWVIQNRDQAAQTVTLAKLSPKDVATQKVADVRCASFQFTLWGGWIVSSNPSPGEEYIALPGEIHGVSHDLTPCGPLAAEVSRGRALRARHVLRKPASGELVTLGALAESGLVKIGKSYA